MAIHIIGSSHISGQSVAEIKRIIAAQQPDFVAVELDLGRLKRLYAPQGKLGLRELLHLGIGGFLFVLVGGWLQKKLGREVGLMPGADMKCAVEAASATGAKLALIDIPIERTLRKISAIRRIEKLKLLLAIFKSDEKIEFDPRKLPPNELIEQVIAIFEHRFPQLYSILIDDRNRWMASKLSALQRKFPHANIVCVVGAGHVNGLRKLLEARDINTVVHKY